MSGIIDKYRNGRDLTALYRLAAFILIGLIFANCSNDEKKDANEDQASSAVPTDGTDGPRNEAIGSEAMSPVGGAGGLKVGTGGSGDVRDAGRVSRDGGVRGAAGRAGSSGRISDAAGGAGGNVATGNEGGNVTAGANGEAGDAEPPDVACDPADITEPPTVYNTIVIGEPPTGPYRVTFEVDPGLPTHTEYRPELKPDVKYPIIVWGNTACSANASLFPEFLNEIASHGFLIIDVGLPDQWTTTAPDGIAMTQAIDWAFKENERPCSQYYHKLDTTKVAAMGQSCGGLMTFAVAGDPRLTTIIIWNSGLFVRDQAVYDSLHTPIAFFCGGPSDAAYVNAEADYAAITSNPTSSTLPIFYGNQNLGHFATYDQDNGGEFARVGIAWLKWHLMGDESPTAKGLFVGANCGLCNTEWDIKKNNLD